MTAFSFIALLLVAVPLIGLAALGLVLAMVSRGTRAAGLAILTIGFLLLVCGGVTWVYLLKYQERSSHEYVQRIRLKAASDVSSEVLSGDAPTRRFESEGAFSSDGGIQVEVVSETAAAGYVEEAPAESPLVESGVSSADAETDEAQPPEADSIYRTLSRAVFRAVADGDPAEAEEDASSEDSTATIKVEAEDASPPHAAGRQPATDVAVDSNSDVVVEALPTAAGRDVENVTAGYGTPDADRPDLAELKRSLARRGEAMPLGTASDSRLPASGEIVPPGRPAWVNAPPFTIDNADYVPVTSGPYATSSECRQALADAMQEAVEEYIDDYRGRENNAKYVAFEPFYIRTQLRHGGMYEETVQASFGPMRQRHALLRFGKEFREEIDRRWKQVVVTSRLAHVALLAMSALAGLATLFVYLRLDTATKGYYSGRLQFAGGAVILGLVALGVLLARWIPWL